MPETIQASHPYSSPWQVGYVSRSRESLMRQFHYGERSSLARECSSFAAIVRYIRLTWRPWTPRRPMVSGAQTFTRRTRHGYIGTRPDRHSSSLVLSCSFVPYPSWETCAATVRQERVDVGVRKALDRHAIKKVRRFSDDSKSYPPAYASLDGLCLNENVLVDLSGNSVGHSVDAKPNTFIHINGLRSCIRGSGVGVGAAVAFALFTLDVGCNSGGQPLYNVTLMRLNKPSEQCACPRSNHPRNR